MKRFVKARSFNIALFWKFFMKYLILILIPAIAASTFTYFYVVNHIEKEIEKSNELVLRQFSDQVDSLFLSLQTDMIRTLNGPTLHSFLKTMDDSSLNQQRIEWVHSLMRQMRTFEEKGFIANAYLYFADADLVVDGYIHTNTDFYYTVKYPVEAGQKALLPEYFSGRKMMHFMQQHEVHSLNNLESTTNQSVVMSYPFNKNQPEVYLVVNIAQDKLDDSIRIHEDWITATAIVSDTGNYISQNGNMQLDQEMISDIIQTEKSDSFFWNSEGGAVSFYQSKFNDSWYFVSHVDLETLMKPAELIRILSMLFLLFFLVLGGIISAYLSRRISNPILEIKTGLEMHRKLDKDSNRSRNEMDLIKYFSDLLISENRQLSGMVNGMVPIAHEFFLKKVLRGEFRDRLSIQLYAREIDFPCEPNARHTVYCIEQQYYANERDTLSEASKSFIMEEIKDKISKAIGNGVWFCQVRNDLLACIVQHDQSQPNTYQIAEQIKQTVMQYDTYFKAVIAIGKTVGEMSDLHVSFGHAVALLQQKSLHEDVEICTEEYLSDGRIYSESFISNDEVARIFNIFKAKEYDKLLHSVCDMLDDGMRNNVSAYQTKNMCVDVLNTWIRAVESEKNDFNLPFYFDLYNRLEQLVTWEEIKQFFHDTHKLLFQATEPHDREQQFAEILDYIQKHYGEDLSIESFAGQMNMSAGNFSRVFKEAVGEKYVEYITRIRLTHAKRLLVETNRKIDEIAEQVGYLGRTSFIRVFRKYEGITPGKYRESYQAAGDIEAGAN